MIDFSFFFFFLYWHLEVLKDISINLKINFCSSQIEPVWIGEVIQEIFFIWILGSKSNWKKFAHLLGLPWWGYHQERKSKIPAPLFIPD